MLLKQRCYHKPVMALRKKLYVAKKKETAIRNKNPLEMGQVILNSIPATLVSHSEGSSTVLSWLQRADAAGAPFLTISGGKGIEVSSLCRIALDYSEESTCYYFLNKNGASTWTCSICEVLSDRGHWNHLTMTLHWLPRTRIFKCLLRWTSAFFLLKDSQLPLSYVLNISRKNQIGISSPTC